MSCSVNRLPRFFVADPEVSLAGIPFGKSRTGDAAEKASDNAYRGGEKSFCLKERPPAAPWPSPPGQAARTCFASTSSR